MSFKKTLFGETPKSILLILLVGILARIIFMLVFVDLSSENYWEYGEIAKNIVSGKGYSLFYFDAQGLNFTSKATAAPLPSAYMPPFYTLLLVPFMLIADIVIRNILILSLNFALVFLTGIFLYRFTTRIFTKQVATFAVVIFAFLPEFIYSANTIGTTSLFHFQIICILYLLSNKHSDFKQILLLGIVISTAILTRSEFLLFYIFLLLLLSKQKQWKTIFVTAIVILIFLAPWQIRNYIVFNKYIPLTTSSGLNFYRGHNPYFVGEWGDTKIDRQLVHLGNRKDFEVLASKIYFQKGFDNFFNNPNQEAIRVPQKLVHLWLMNVQYLRINTFFYWLPWLIILISFVIVLYKKQLPKNLAPTYLFLLSTTLASIIFFALPRYQTMMKIAMIPISAFALVEFYHLLAKGKAKSYGSSDSTLNS